jgi:phosphatidylethanolamine-binding protein (PEBP) family uncharacterized protein
MVESNLESWSPNVLVVSAGAPGGKDISSQLSWSVFPAETESFVVTMDDPEAPTGSGVHEYYITVTALDEATSGLGANASGAFLGFNIAGHTIARASLVCPTSAS